MISISIGTVLRLAVAMFTGTTWSPFLPTGVGALEPVQPASANVAQMIKIQLKIRFRETTDDERFIIPFPFSGHPPRSVRADGSPGARSRIIAIPCKDVEGVGKGYRFATFSITYS